MTTERRKYPRTPAKIEATLVLGDGVDRIPGAITDISGAGARVSVDDPAKVSGPFYMLVPEHGLQPCRLVWRRKGTMGLSFKPL